MTNKMSGCGFCRAIINMVKGKIKKNENKSCCCSCCGDEKEPEEKKEKISD